jgi:hypothetical protein
MSRSNPFTRPGTSCCDCSPPSNKAGVAPAVLERFGSDARGDRIYRAGHALGQRLRTIYLCDYSTLPDFRRSVYQVLERGESVHALQRQICTQALPPKRGRRAEELITTSGALTLVTICVMAWNTQRLQRAVDREAKRTAPRYCIDAIKGIGQSATGTSTSAAPFDSQSIAMRIALSLRMLRDNRAATQQRNRDFLHERYATPGMQDEGNWAQLEDGILIGRHTIDDLYLCDGCAQPLQADAVKLHIVEPEADVGAKATRVQQSLALTDG